MLEGRVSYLDVSSPVMNCARGCGRRLQEEARMAVIATVSPNPTDTEHSITTLRTASMISGNDQDCRELKEDVPMTVQMAREAHRQVAPVHWSHSDVVDWLRVRSHTMSPCPCLLRSSAQGV